MTGRRLARLVPLAAAAAAGAVVAVAVLGGTPAPAAPAPPRVTTATVVRANLATTVLTGGTLGYASTRPVINQVTGTYTWLPAAGTMIRRGQALYRVDDRPVVLMTGRTPAWRPFGPGMAAGPDVSELQANLIALGYARGLFAARDGSFDVLTADAVERWQAASGYLATGQVALGQVVFLPAAVLVAAPDVAPGQRATPGQLPYLVTTARRAVMVPLSPDLPAVGTGQAVSIILPAGTTTPGRVTAVGPPASSVSGRAGAGGSHAPATSVATVRPLRPVATGTGADVPVQVSLTVQAVRHVLAVPVTALLALAGGGYGVELVTRSGAHRLVAVVTGIFAGGRVQVSGPAIAAGARVVVAQ